MVLLSSSFARDVKWSHVASHPKITPSLPSWPAEGAVSVSMQVQLANSCTGGTQQCSVPLRKNSFSHGSEGPTWGLSGRPASAPPQSTTQLWFFRRTTQTLAVSCRKLAKAHFRFRIHLRLDVFQGSGLRQIPWEPLGVFGYTIHDWWIPQSLTWDFRENIYLFIFSVCL